MSEATNSILSIHEGNKFNDGMFYQKKFGDLQYTALTRLDITYVVNKEHQIYV